MLGLAAFGLVVALFLWRNEGFQWDRFANTFRGLDPWWLTIATFVSLSTYLGRALRWQILIRPQKQDSSLKNLFIATSIGFTAIVLFGRPGEMVRPYLIARKENLTFSSQVGAWLLERIYDLLMALLVFGFALSQARSAGMQVGDGLRWVLEVGGYFVATLSAVCLVVLFLLARYTETMQQRLFDGIGFLPEAMQMRLRSMLAAFAHGVASTRSIGYVFQILGYSVLEWILIVTSYYYLLRAVPGSAHFTYIDVSIFVGFIAFGNVVQIPGVGGGLQVVAVLVLTELFHLPLETASGVAVLLWLVTFVVIVPLGLLLALHEGIQFNKLRQISEVSTQEGA